MSQRRDLEANLRSLGEIRDILTAMKNMARMEVHRLGRFLETQRKVVASILATAADFRTFHPELFLAEETREVFLLLGSERGFCGDFNESVLRAFEAHGGGTPNASVVVVGSKLCSKTGDALPQATFLVSASVADEIEGMLIQVMDSLSRVQGPGSAASLRLTVFHHHEHREGIRVSVLDPFEQSGVPPQRFPYPPDLLLDPASFARELMEQYLFARLHELLYRSLLAENQARMEHLESTVQRLERKSAELLRRRNVLRQEEITEEIEVIMLSAELMD
jgi:F-type H+-transporting ATPase subunit gamma